jgi:hypothetical protein
VAAAVSQHDTRHVPGHGASGLGWFRQHQRHQQLSHPCLRPAL